MPLFCLKFCGSPGEEEVKDTAVSNGYDGTTRANATDSIKTLSTNRKLEHTALLNKHKERANKDIFMQQVTDANDDDDEDYPEPQDREAFEKSKSDFEFLKDVLEKNVVFDGLSDENRKYLIDHLEVTPVQMNDTIIRQGQKGEYYYVVKEGTILVYVENKKEEDDIHNGDANEEKDVVANDDVKEGIPSSDADDAKYESAIGSFSLIGAIDAEDEAGEAKFKAPKGKMVQECSQGDTFGELSLLFDSPCAATCITSTDGELWRIRGRAFRRIMKRNVTEVPTDTCMGENCPYCKLGEENLRPIPIFSDFLKDTMCKVARTLTALKFEAGDEIIKKGDEGTTFCIIKEGTVRFHDFGGGDAVQKDITVGKGDFFGERALMTGERRACSATADTKTVLLVMGRDDFERKLGPMKKLIERAFQKKRLVSARL